MEIEATPSDDRKRDVAISMSESEIAMVREITMVDAAAPGVLAIVRRAIADYKAKRN